MAPKSFPAQDQSHDSSDHTLSQVRGFVSLQSVVSILETLQKRDSWVIVSGGLSPEHPEKFCREKWEIFCGRVLALGTALDQIRELSKNLLGEKPSLPTAFVGHLRDVLNDAAGAIRFYLPKGRAVVGETALLGIKDFMASLDAFPTSGSAEEQPEPREESRPPIGNPPVTAAGANPSLPAIDDAAGDYWLETAPIAEVLALSEACLDALDSRGASSRWSAA